MAFFGMVLVFEYGRNLRFAPYKPPFHPLVLSLPDGTALPRWTWQSYPMVI